MTTACTQGAHHIGLAVRDVAEARDFFVEALGFGVAAERPDYPAIFVTDGTTLLTLWQVADPAGATAFDRRANIGLHHLALRVADLDALRTVFARVQNHPGTVIELSEVAGPKGEMFRLIREASEAWDGQDPVRPFPDLKTL